MPDTPAPLTDEQIDELTDTARADFVASAADEDEIRADHETFDRWYAAVIAKAKREERVRVGRELIEAIREERDGDDWSWDTALMKAEVEVEVICGLEATHDPR